MASSVHVAFAVWPLALLLVVQMSRRRRDGVLLAVVMGWLFLPVAQISIPGLPNIDKAAVIGIGLLGWLGWAEGSSLRRLRFTVIDGIAIAWVCSGFLSSISNGLGAWDGLSASFGVLTTWGLPYLFGRVYLRNEADISQLARILIIGALVYAPFCWLEMRLSPQLHTWVYGFHQHVFGQTRRFGGFRPVVFLQHGLAVAQWMAICAVLAASFLGSRKKLGSSAIPPSVPFLMLAITAILCRSAGAWAMLAMGLAVLLVANRGLFVLPIVGIMLISPLYVVMRVGAGWRGDILIRAAELVLPGSKGGSLAYRLVAEDAIISRALERPLLGWGGWNRFRPEQWGDGVSAMAADSLWVITLGQKGILGLVLVVGMLCMPGLRAVARLHRTCDGSRPSCAPVVVGLVLALGLYALDCLFNAMVNPCFMIVAGVLNSWGAGAGFPDRRMTR